MSDSGVILKVEGLSKTYFSKHQPQRSIKDLITAPFHRAEEETDKVEALKGVSFELKRGESLGIIGPNGAGKSTLLKILGGVTSPTSGKVTINGRVLSVLDIGTGFHPDLTGRENVYLNGEILGMSRKEIDLKYKEIVEFSGIGEFINRPVKQYSSGMYLRLAFSIVVTLDADLLLFDEVLAVGDRSFQEKCSTALFDIIKQGRSVVLVSHNLSEVLNLCDSAFILNHGLMRKRTNSTKVVGTYLSKKSEKQKTQKLTRLKSSVKLLSFNSFGSSRFKTNVFNFNEPISIMVRYRLSLSDSLDVSVILSDLLERKILGFSTFDSRESNLTGPGVYEFSFIIPKGVLNYGKYGFNFYVLQDGVVLDKLENVHSIEVKNQQASQNSKLYLPIRVSGRISWKKISPP